MTETAAPASHLRRLYASRHALAATLLLSSTVAMAYPGEALLTWARTYIIAPVGLLAIVIGVFASIFRPDMIRGAAYTAIICAVLFFIIQNANTLMTAMQ